MSQSAVDKLKEIVHLQANLWDAAHRLPEGVDRQSALREISGFQSRLVALLRRFGAEGAEPAL